MPSMYEGKDFDLAGFAVGMAEIDEIDRTKFVKEGDTLIALPSSGLHSNGFSLARKVVSKKGLKFDDEIEGEKLIDLLLRPTRIYVKEFLELKYKIKIEKFWQFLAKIYFKPFSVLQAYLRSVPLAQVPYRGLLHLLQAPRFFLA